MKEFKDKVLDVEKKYATKWGGFNLFALFEREDIKDKYDLVLSFDLKGKTENEVFKALHQEFKNVLTNSELNNFSRFVFLEPDHAVVNGMNAYANVQHSDVDIKNSSIGNFKIYHAIVFSSQRKPIKSK